jgi:plastocyanin domain-containing protein
MRPRTLTLVALLGALAGLAACDRRPGPGEPVKITVTKRGFEPWKVQAKKDVPLTLVITRTTDETCAKELVLPEQGIHQELPLDEPVTVSFTPARAGELRYACAMNMFQGVIEVR